MTIDEIRGIRSSAQSTEREYFDAHSIEIVDTLLTELDEKEERLAIKDDALRAAIMAGEFAISKLRTATEALERIVADGDFSAPEGMKRIDAAVLQVIEKEEEK